ncbi:hypothetical protein [Sinisalibacter aestuarii]|uniref:Sulfotransferase family protein n=1 Tax=Sinisalibacter aestuarii TaxID=2949426 RepID=A0ABQ5LUU8_9RHOB|nr:hypothetical protein [Sinisalibacter aestuarii]GKY88760.1 hypothetical protein STA1M1_26290 [Sinisalibacter aestuarii]
MIVSHTRKLIFIKTKKVGGSSFEMALSAFCGPDCVITPLGWGDEKARQALAGRGAQNFENTRWPDGSVSAGGFVAHETAPSLKARIPAAIWRDYRKITIWRNPFDAVISRYYWRRRTLPGLDFGAFVAQNPDLIDVNTEIAPLSGPARLDTYLAYENLEAELAAIGLGDVWEVFRGLSAKGQSRPKEGASVAEIYAQFPGAAAAVARACAEEIAHFGYDLPAS